MKPFLLVCSRATGKQRPRGIGGGFSLVRAGIGGYLSANHPRLYGAIKKVRGMQHG